VKVLELAGGVMDELASPVGPRKDLVQNHCLEFMQLIKVILALSLNNSLFITRLHWYITIDASGSISIINII
jgi:hypothetical protein